jgi:hypothetical protein
VIFHVAAGSSHEPLNRLEDRMRTRKRLAGALLVAALGIMALMLPGIAAAKDRNHDRIPDRWEKRHGLSVRVNQAHRDQDRDKLVNRQEWKAGDDPLDRDSDNDGTPDGQEGAGTIASFDGTTLTIDLFHGQSLSGLVTDATEIKCEGANRGPGNDGEDGNRGPGNGDDDNGGQGGDDKVTASDHGGDDGPGHDEGDGNENASCSTADLVPGAVVDEAELRAASGDAVFHEVELAGDENGDD